MVSQRPLPVLFVFLAKQGPEESEARVGLCSVPLYILRHRLQDCVLKKPPMWAPPFPPRSNVWVPLVKPLSFCKSPGVLPLWSLYEDSRCPGERGGGCSGGRRTFSHKPPYAL